MASPAAKAEPAWAPLDAAVVPRRELLNALSGMARVTERRTTIPVLAKALLFTAGGVLNIKATDLDVTLENRLPVVAPDWLGVAVHLATLRKMIKACPSPQITFRQDEEGWIWIEAEATRYKLYASPVTDFPSLPRVADAPPRSLDGPGLRRCIDRTLYAISSEASRFQLNGALLRFVDGGMDMVSTDGHRLALCRLADIAGPEDRLLVSRKALAVLGGLKPRGPVALTKGETHTVELTSLPARGLTLRILEGVFPPYEKIIATHDKIVTFDRVAFSSAVSRAALLASFRMRGIRMFFAPGSLTIKAVNMDLGEAEITCPVGYDGVPFSLACNPDYLLDWARHVGAENFSGEFKDGDSTIVFRAGSYVSVVMPTRM